MAKPTPTCAVCGAKFSFDRQTQLCNNCGAPAEVSELSKADLRRYKVDMKLSALGITGKRGMKRALREQPANRFKHRRKHGRQVRVAS